MSWLHGDRFLKIAGFVVLAAIGVKQATPDHTIANKVADIVISVGASLGVYSTAGREQKAK